ncbi:hypothetical protein BT96DRAFT_515542 [Gymnopus androsaceus JB14]|uniref:G domain-containing protein n=1 Tax=Gymnopus androsaceus JB14 TaxID=1447944 RepID=A0A6A4I0D7_9AGAR|nr:hypothetical protein BT96DRAFT_515542 [Gymnopus androsaceus JB14]
MLQAPPNIVIFGSTGSGKSSVVNMIRGPAEGQAPISSGAEGCTFQSNSYSIDIGDQTYRLWDTSGLDEGMGGTVISQRALENLCRLVKQLSHGDEGGVSLLMFVMKGPRITDAARKNYRMFYEGFCRKKVPVVIVVTGMENEPNMDDWWYNNAWAFNERNMLFHGHACITATTGKLDAITGRGLHADAYEQSIRTVKKLIADYCAEEGWKKVLFECYPCSV